MQSPHGMGGGMGGNLQEMQRLLQQQQQQYRQQQQQQQPQQMNAGRNPNMGGLSQAFGGSQQQFNPAAMMQQQQQPGGSLGNNQLQMMQQQQQAPQQNMGGGGGGMQSSNSNVASIYGNLGGFPSQGMIGSTNNQSGAGGQSSSMDASSGSSARLLAMAGMNMNNPGSGGRPNSSSTMQNMQMLLQQQQQNMQQNKSSMGNMMSNFGNIPGQQQSSQPQHHQQQPGPGGMMNANMVGQSPMMGRSTDGQNSGNSSQQQMMLQQQLANLQKLQGQLQGNMGGGSSGMQGGSGGMQQQGQQMMGSPGTSTNALQSRQQQLLQQIQQQQQQQQQGSNSGSNANAFLQQRLGMMQQLARQNQQPQNQQQGQNFSNSMSNFMGNQGQSGMSSQNSIGGGSVGSRPSNDQQMMMQNQSGVQSQNSQQQGNQQSQMMGQGMQNAFGSQNQQNSFSSGQMGQMMSDMSNSRHSTHQQMPQPNSQESTSNMADSSAHSHHSGGSGGTGGGNMSIAGLRDMTSNLNSQRSFLDGSFEGGWQSNADIPDRRRVIFSILDVIRQSHGAAAGDEAPNKLPHMAKTLEEHLYRSARTKAEYLDAVTLRRRLQRIAQGLDIHRTGSQDDLDEQSSQNNGMMQGGQNSNFSGNNGTMMAGQNAAWNGMQQGNSMGHMPQMNQGQPANMQQNQMLSQMQQQQNPNSQSQGLMSQMQQGGWSQMSSNLQDTSMMSQSNIGMDSSQGHGSVTMSQSGWPGDAGSVQDQGNPINPEYPNTPKFQDPDASQKKKVILQQQQRLLLLRHASKCKAGQACTTKFCNQMVVLWKHMKTCRDKNCKTSHCLSSRCVLNHYRICKSQGRTATCEVCGPVMNKIKLQGRDDGSVDPLGGDPLSGSTHSLPSMQDQQQNSQMANMVQMMAQQRGQVGSMPVGMQNQQQMQPQMMPGIAMGMLSNQQQMLSNQQQQQLSNQQQMQQMLSNQQQQQQTDSASVASGSSSQRKQAAGTVGNSNMQGGSMNAGSNMVAAMSGGPSVNPTMTSANMSSGNSSSGGMNAVGLSASNISANSMAGSNMNTGNLNARSMPSSGSMNAGVAAAENMNAGSMTAVAAPATTGTDASTGGAAVGGGDSASSQSADQTQLHQLKQHQLKMQAQLESLKELQRQQQQLLDQQTRLREQSMLVSDANSPQAQQLQQQQLLLDELQKRCQQQQSRLQKEIEVQSSSVSMNQTPTSAAAAEQQQVSQQLSQQLQQFASEMAATSAQFGAGLAGVLAKSNTSSQPTEAFPQSNDDGPVDAFGELASEEAEAASAAKKKRGANANVAKQNRGGKGKRVKGKGIRQHIEELQAETAGVKDSKDSSGDNKRKQSSDSEGNDGSQKRAKSDAAPAPTAPVSLPDNKSSLISFMTKESITKHLESLNKRVRLSSRTVTHKCLPVIQELIDDQFGWVFHDAVDPVALGLPDYFEVVKKPMHLELVKKKLENAIYPEMDMFARDVRLVFENAILYNGETSEVGELAQAMLLKFDKLYSDLVQGVESSQLQLENRGEACSLCAQQKRRFEPAVLYCQGQCGMQRIKRGATYYTERTKSNHWCEDCFNALDDEKPIQLDDGTEISKSDLQEFKNDALPEEAWVNCDVCSCWVHQICALFNGRTNKSKATFVCPNCYLANTDTSKEISSSDKFKSAADLPHCKLSREIEEGVQNALEKAYEDRAKDSGLDVKDVDKAEKLSIRVVSSVDKKFLVGDEMIKRYADKKCPDSYPVRSKCIALFQEIHGIDTLLFALYVYEYGDECPAPNRRRVYISYLDSVKYFEPKAYRTLVYQRILVEYLKSVKARGFHTAHIWSCPPTPGDDYIFYCHPQHQLTPREDMLRSWYHSTIEKAKTEGIVIRSTNLYDEYFNEEVSEKAVKSMTPVSLPYFEGDYIPGEIENIIRQVKKTETVEGSADEVMRRLGQNLSKMKENFIVVHLRSRRFAEAVENGEDVSKFPEDSDDELVRSKRAKISGKGLSDSSSAESGNKLGLEAADVGSAISQHKASLSRCDSFVPQTLDEDPPVESEMFESRQQFLNYCQTNHCQFDELRRAKHSTMMVLFQLHNPSEPKFLIQCSACYRDMTHGFRYHCNNCSNFDLCEECYEPVTTGQWAKRDARFAHDSSHTFKKIDMESPQESPATLEERQKALNSHIQLLEHAGACSGECSLQNCSRMKKLFEHVTTCDAKPKSGCKICTRLLSLCAMHARNCTATDSCPIPFCDRLRERNRRVRRQQQLMDDRRRQAQNELYHAGRDS